jgi:hypothetical protein
VKHVTLKLTVDEAIALNNYTMQLIAPGPGRMDGKNALGRIAKKLLKTLNQVDPIK